MSARDTEFTVVARHRALVASLSPTERLQRALSLSSLTRSFAWEGARRHSGQRGTVAVVERFMRQLYGDEAERLLALVRRARVISE